MDELIGGPGPEVAMLLCDAAQVSAGKLYVLGGGLSLIGPRPQPLALAIQVYVPWDRANIGHQWEVRLCDEDGQPVTVRDKAVTIAGRFEAGRPAGHRPGTPLGVSLAINLTPLPLPGATGYLFELSIDGRTKPGWRIPFYVRAPEPHPSSPSSG